VKEAPLREGLPLEAASFLACVATIAELPVSELPDDPDAVHRWLGGIGLGLVQVADPGAFAWPGPWLGRVRPPGGEPRYAVLYGVPSGVVWDPGGDGAVEREWVEEGFLVAAGDVALGRRPPTAPPAGTGMLEEIWIAAAAGEPARRLESARALAGRGLEGDRHVAGAGTFPTGVPGSALTLIAAEVCESFDPPLGPDEHRRNLVTRGIDLNALVGCEFAIGGVRCRGMRLCEPCRVMQGYADRPVLRPLVHRGGLRADILEDGNLQVGDAVRANV
jgi:MOSC domain